MKILKFFSKVKQAFSDEEEDYTKRLQIAIKNACDKTREATQEVCKRSYDIREKELIRDYEFKLAEKDELITQYTKTIFDLQTQIENNQKAYQNYVHEAISIKRIIAEVSHQMERVFSKSGELYQGFKNIQDAIEFQNMKLEEADDKNRNLLGMSEKQNKLLVRKNKVKGEY